MKILEIGCGLTRHGDTTIAIDKIASPAVDIVRDVARRGIPFADNSFEKVYTFDVIEHIEHYEDFIFLLNEIWRVLVPNGLFHFTVPSGVQHGFAHMTHHRVFVPSSFQYLGNNLPGEFEHMRKSDGIIARFGVAWVERSESQLEGKFTAIK